MASARLKRAELELERIREQRDQKLRRLRILRIRKVLMSAKIHHELAELGKIEADFQARKWSGSDQRRIREWLENRAIEIWRMAEKENLEGMFGQL